ncbi:MAG: SPOR domain-containing protein [Paracoccaceae bacterium]
MADRDFAEYGVPQAYGPGKAQRMVQLAGAGASVALVLGLAVWGYKLAVRDISGVPIIHATAGSMRIAPEEPGGSVADHQGLAVNEVAAMGGVAPPADRLVLAPKPVDLSLEDVAGLAGAVAAADADLVPARLDQPADLVPLTGDGTDPAVSAALSAALGLDDAVDDALDEVGVETASLDAQGLPAPEGAITRSLRPMPRPSHDGAPAAAATAPITAVEVDPATLAPGTRLVQFGAFDSDKEARAEWVRLAGRFGDLMAGKSMVIQAAESGGRTFYRLRALGFESEDDARRFCSALVTESTNCIPVAHR